MKKHKQMNLNSLPSGFITHLLIDIDGCLNASDIGRPIDLAPLQKLKQYNQQAKTNPTIPQITLLTGRCLPYAEVFSQILDIHLYFGFEMGMVVAQAEGAVLNIVLDDRLPTDITEIIEKFEHLMFGKYPQFKLYHQLGKYHMCTFVFESHHPIIQECVAAAHSIISEYQFPFEVDVGHNFINIQIQGMNKSLGFDLICKENGIEDPSRVAGIGDSNSDWDFLAKCGFSACPANGSQLLREKCDYIAKYVEGEGSVEIMEKIIATNASLLESLEKSEN